MSRPMMERTHPSGQNAFPPMPKSIAFSPQVPPLPLSTPGVDTPSSRPKIIPHITTKSSSGTLHTQLRAGSRPRPKGWPSRRVKVELRWVSWAFRAGG